MSFVRNNTALEFNNSFSSRQVNGDPVFEGGYLLSDTGSFYREGQKKEGKGDFYLQIKCGANLSATGVSLIRENKIEEGVKDENSFAFFIKNYSDDTKSTMFMGDILLRKDQNDGRSFDCLLSRDIEDSFYLKTSNGEIGGKKYIEDDEFRSKTFFQKLNDNNGQKIFGMDVAYSDGEVLNMSPSIRNEFSFDLGLRRDGEGRWNEAGSFSIFVPIAIIDLDSKSTINLHAGNVSIGMGGGNSVGINGKSGPLF
jgi:hypothetical protein